MIKISTFFLTLITGISMICDTVYAECQISAGEHGYDEENRTDFVKSETVTKKLVVLVDCSFDSAPEEIKIRFNLGGRQCKVFDWRYNSQFGYVGAFPTGLKGDVDYQVESQDGAPLGSSSFKIATAKKVQNGCSKGAKKCRKKLTALNRKEKKAACTELIGNLRGPIILEP